MRAGYTPASGGLAAVEAALAAGGAARGTLDTVHACSTGARARAPDAGHGPPHAGAHAGPAAESSHEAARPAGARAEPGASNAAHAAPSPRRVNGAAAPGGGGPAVRGEAVDGERDSLARRPWRRRGQEVRARALSDAWAHGSTVRQPVVAATVTIAVHGWRAVLVSFVERGMQSRSALYLPGSGVAHRPQHSKCG